MANQKISELSEIVTVENTVDVLPIVDVSANTTKKVTPNALKVALQLNNVDNTSDANKPISSAQQNALDAKIDKNSPITGGSAPKITFDANGLVTSGDALDEIDLPTGINANKIATGIVSNAEFEYLNGVTDNIQTQFSGKQDTLVSGTNIKTINSTSLLGSGDITISGGGTPSGGAGSIQFSDGSAFASDSNLFWDNTNKRLGVGTNNPQSDLDILTSNGVGFIRVSANGGGSARITGDYSLSLNARGNLTFENNLTEVARITSVGMGIKTLSNPTARLEIKGSGSTSATTSLLVQDSSSTELLKVRDDGLVTVKGENVITQTSVSPNSVSKMWSGSQTQYNALTPDSSTVYFIV